MLGLLFKVTGLLPGLLVPMGLIGGVTVGLVSSVGGGATGGVGGAGGVGGTGGVSGESPCHVVADTIWLGAELNPVPVNAVTRYRYDVRAASPESVKVVASAAAMPLMLHVRPSSERSILKPACRPGDG